MKIDRAIFDGLVHNRPPERVVMRQTPNRIQGLIDFILYVVEGRTDLLVEIGTFLGESSEFFAKAFKQVITIDTDELLSIGSWPDEGTILYLKDEQLAGYHRYLQNLPNTNIRKITNTSVEASTLFEDNSIDVLYIDGCHEKECIEADIAAWRSKVKIGGFIAGHDYCPEWQTVINEVNRVWGKPDRVFQDSSWVVKNV